MNTNFDHDVFWEVINTSIQNIYDCIVNQEFTTILNQVERANHIPFAYWLSSLLSSTRIYDKVLEAQPTRVKSTISQFDKFQFDYTASEEYESAKQLFDREIRLKGYFGLFLSKVYLLSFRSFACFYFFGYFC